ncbi:MAG: UxaA family hydrolase [Bacteroidaceae bacterium]|nr:UxaA family hydrolase [Bacteroidaceae bacterium]
MGHATRAIRKGELVDHHNIATNLSGTIDYKSLTPNPSPVGEGNFIDEGNNSPLPLGGGAGGEAFFLGYVRPDGQVGIRNDIWVIPTVGCVNGICRQIVEQAKEQINVNVNDNDNVNDNENDNDNVNDNVNDNENDNDSQLSTLNSKLTLNSQLSTLNYFPHNYGCSQLGDDHENTRKILRDMILHPNAGGVLVVGLGCENNQPKEFEKMLGDYDRQRIRFMVCQEVEGDEVEVGVRIVRELYAQAQTYERVPVPVSKLRVGLKCGGSDGFSGITANPLLGAFTDWLCKEQGGTAILTEVPEMFGSETILMRRAVSEEVLQQTISLVNNFKEYFLSHGQPVGENPSPGNKAGGISTLEEKALGCTQKAGTAPVVGVLAYGDRLPQAQGAAPIINCQLSIVNSGLFLLSAPGNDLVASTALAAAGCQLVLFTTGRGTPFSTFVPTLKVSTNSDLARRKPQWIDFDAGVLLDGTSMEELLQRFIAYIIDVASGKERTTAEVHGNAEFAIFKNGVTL